MTGVNLEGAKLEGVTFINTIMPDGTIRNETPRR
ncbi:hypothetical protein [Anabaena cylindrica]|nr:hypothetical protein [Anabaena cylindrica]